MLKKNLHPRSYLPNIKLSHLLLLQAARLRRNINSALIENCDLTLSEKELLALVHRAGGQARMSDVSDGLMFTEGGATKIIGRLLGRGFVTRQRSKEDKRVVLVDITDAGEEKLFEALKVVGEVVHSLLKETLSSEERAVLSRLLKKLDSHL